MHRTDGDGWLDCSCGRRHWGRLGAAGLLLVSLDGRVLLQHRAVWSHEGGTWAVPGGARSSTERPVDTALREAAEEAGVHPGDVEPVFAVVDDHGSWSYTTVVAHTGRTVETRPADPESVELRWVPLDDVSSFPLHPAFDAAWPQLRDQAMRRLALVVDAANVVGSRPDGWWRDRLAANRRLRDALVVAADRGFPAEELGLPANWWWPGIRLVVEGQARELEPVRGVEVLPAPRDGDTLIAQTVDNLVREHADDHIVVVTADRLLRGRLAPRVHVVGPRTLLRLLER
ncbi:MAG: NUDIX hydrolase [Jiangellaceae bacterium]|nr:NUDIX hydrolase [Jiangellaceae bacterium]